VANWGGLNNALAAWRVGLNAILPGRSTRSDGARADGNHASTSEHQPDADGTVDAFDEDRNYLNSSDPTGNAIEDRIHAALNADFMADSRAHLIISDRKIRNDLIDNWRSRDYTGASPHTEHTHRQVHQSKEDDGRPWKFTRTRALLEELTMPSAVEIAEAVWDKTTTPAGATTAVTMETIQRWRDAAEVDTRNQIKAAVAAAKEEILAAIGAAVAELTPPPGGTDAG
jgi:hypothetical protein